MSARSDSVTRRMSGRHSVRLAGFSPLLKSGTASLFSERKRPVIASSRPARHKGGKAR